MFTPEDYAKRYQVLKEMSLKLDPDPVAVGLSSLTMKLAEVQEIRNRAAKALAEAIHNTSEAEISKRTLENQMEAQTNNFMMTDDFVRSQKSDKMREIAAQSKIPEFVLQMHQKEVDLVRAEAYEKFVKQIYDTLEAANSNLSRQISVIQMSIQIGEVDASSLPGSQSVTLKRA